VERLVALMRQEVQINWANLIATELLEEAHQRVTDRAAQNHHEITTHIPDIVPMAYGDFYQSLLILTDLLDNAIRYTPPGGHIRLSVDSLGTHVLFTVSDNGIGLRPEDTEKVGKPFWRGDHHPLVRYNASGTGLSLFLAKQILALQDGELIFSGEPDLGSTFSFTLPAPT
jgi:signal transduction histidine kinase